VPPATAPAQSPTSAGAGSQNSTNRNLAQSGVGYWIDVMRSNAETDVLGQYFSGDNKLAMELVGEYSNAARRLGLDASVREMMDRISGNLAEEMDMTIEKSAFACSSIINRFVTRLNFDQLPEAARPRAPTADGRSLAVFAERKAANGAREISLEPSNQQYDALSEWMYAFHQMVEDNAKSIDGLDINIEQNLKLGSILSQVPSGAAS
jgi:hypothetical protein